MAEVKESIFSKKGEVESHRELVSKALSLDKDQQSKVKSIWTEYTTKLENDCQTGQISF